MSPVTQAVWPDPRPPTAENLLGRARTLLEEMAAVECAHPSTRLGGPGCPDQLTHPQDWCTSCRVRSLLQDIDQAQGAATP